MQNFEFTMSESWGCNFIIEDALNLPQMTARLFFLQEILILNKNSSKNSEKSNTVSLPF